MDFKQIHQQNSPLLLCNVWDVKSAQIAKELNFKAIGTSSSAIATMLGYSDGEEISFNELKYIVSRISQTVNIPLSVDLEAGYNKDPFEIADNIIMLSELGVVGVNIEDSLVNDKRLLVDAKKFSKKLNDICTKLNAFKKDVFLNIRTDTFLLGCAKPIKETIERTSRYKDAGADGIFVPCIEQINDIKAVISKIELPLNVMCMPKLPNFEILKNIGVKRISMGGFVYNQQSKNIKNQLQKIQSINSFNCLFE